ncbi:TonB-dependent receptor [Bowmanella pacifica]|uniref:TonB-dependent receptor n=1 Tax=Bowmanella pacifica TaxID=502051 RepID=A0A917YSM3_9ALTE|nr:TonB-dependent receptor [Bowmanella pacifica]GGO65313.1 TonB-dependent receptor [Bowmanella pacifica]
MKFNHLKRSLLTTSISLILTSHSSLSFSQTNTTGADEIEILNVTGTRLQNQRAASLKSEAEQILDGITADEIGSLPDFSVSEALSRIAGISTEDRNGDAEFVVIRGMRSDFNYLSIDGAIVPSTRNNGRATQLSIIPSSVIDTTTVSKSFSADMDANAIGGNINVRTRSAFDYDDTYFFMRGALGKYDNDKSPAGNDLASRANFTYADSFGADGQFGLVVSGSYLTSDRGTWLPGVAYNEYRVIGERINAAGETEQYTTRTYEDGLPNSVEIPHGTQNYQYNNEMERSGGLVKLEYRNLDDSLYLSLSSYMFKEEDTEQRWDTSIFRAKEGDIPANITATSGEVDSAISQRMYFLQGDENKLKSITATARYQPSEEHLVQFLASQASGDRENPFYQIRFQNNDRSALAYSYDTSGKYPVITLNTPENWTNTELFTPVFYRPRFDINNQDASQIKLDYKFNWQRFEGLAFKAGVSTRTDLRKQDQIYDHDYRPNSPETKAFTLTNVLSDFTNRFEPDLMPGQLQQFIDPTKFLEHFTQNESQWVDKKNQLDEALSSQFEVEETINAAYIMARYKSEDLTLLGGLRYEQTEVDSTGGQKLNDDDPSTPNYVLVSQSGSYNNLLPSLQVNYNLNDNTKIRLAYSETLGRAEYSDLAVRGSKQIDDTNQSISISSGNTNLKPRESKNTDISLEYYLPKQGIFLSAGAFNKSIDNEIYTRKTNEMVIINGSEYSLSTKQPDNASETKLYGMEVGILVNSFSSISENLKDFGISANYSHIESEFNIEISEEEERELFGLLYQPKDIGNLSIFWTPDRFDIRLAMRYKGKRQVSSSASSPSYDEFVDKQTFWDLRGQYKFRNGIAIYVEGRNLTDEEEDQLLNSGRAHWTRDFGKSFWLGAAYKF